MYWESDLSNTVDFHQNHRFREIPMSFSFLFRDHRSMYISRSKTMGSSSIFFMLAKETISIHENFNFKEMWVHVSTNINLNTLNEHIIKIIMKYIEF